MAVAMLGGSVCAMGSYFIEGLTPVTMPSGCGEKKFLALSQYAMIGGFIVSVITAIAQASMANLAIIALIPLCFIGAYAAKMAVLHTTINEKTAEVNKANEVLQKNAARMEKNLGKLTNEVDKYEKVSKDREKEAKNLVEELGKSRLELDKRARQTAKFKKISTTFGDRVGKLGGMLGKSLQGMQKVGAGLASTSAKFKENISRLDEENEETEDHLELLGKLLDELEGIVTSIVALQKQTDETLATLRKEKETWQVDELVKVLKEAEEEIGDNITELKGVVGDALNRMEDAGKTKEELQARIKKAKARLEEGGVE